MLTFHVWFDQKKGKKCTKFLWATSKLYQVTEYEFLIYYQSKNLEKSYLALTSISC